MSTHSGILRLDVFGKHMVAEYREGRWRISLPGTDGKRRSIPDLRVPSDIVTEEALLTFLHDVYHEAATAKHNTVSVIERKRTGHS